MDRVEDGDQPGNTQRTSIGTAPNKVTKTLHPIHMPDFTKKDYSKYQKNVEKNLTKIIAIQF